tara:strand:- start:244 stop:582 length:339 start_codon:yes stop_codon:yes gene_type:complete
MSNTLVNLGGSLISIGMFMQKFGRKGFWRTKDYDLLPPSMTKEQKEAYHRFWRAMPDLSIESAGKAVVNYREWLRSGNGGEFDSLSPCYLSASSFVPMRRRLRSASKVFTSA